MSARHEAQQFAETVDTDARAVPVVAALGLLAAGLRAAAPTPAPAFKAALRARLVAEMATLPLAAPGAHAPSRPGSSATRAARTARAARPGPLGWAAGPAATFTAGGLAVAVAAGGVTLAASRAHPGDLFYGVKRTVEGAQVGLAGSPTAAGVSRLEHAQTRLAELAALLRGHPALPETAAYRRVAATLAALDAEVRDGLRELLDAARAGSATATRDLARLTARASARLDALLALLPESLRPSAQSTLHQIAVARANLPLLPGGQHIVPGPGPSESGTPGGQPTTPAPSGSTSPGGRTTGPAPTGSPDGRPSPSVTVPVPTGTVPVPTITVPVPTVPVATPTIPTVPTTLPKVLPTTLPPL